ncbi:MAG: hypothetical protein AAB294_06110 [Pseudomonadota bacterium]
MIATRLAHVAALPVGIVPAFHTVTVHVPTVVVRFARIVPALLLVVPEFALVAVQFVAVFYELVSVLADFGVVVLQFRMFALDGFLVARTDGFAQLAAILVALVNIPGQLAAVSADFLQVLPDLAPVPVDIACVVPDLLPVGTRIVRRKSKSLGGHDRHRAQYNQSFGIHGSLLNQCVMWMESVRLACRAVHLLARQ